MAAARPARAGPTARPRGHPRRPVLGPVPGRLPGEPRGTALRSAPPVPRTAVSPPTSPKTSLTRGRSTTMPACWPGRPPLPRWRALYCGHRRRHAPTWRPGPPPAAADPGHLAQRPTACIAAAPIVRRCRARANRVAAPAATAVTEPQGPRANLRNLAQPCAAPGRSGPTRARIRLRCCGLRPGSRRGLNAPAGRCPVGWPTAPGNSARRACRP